MKKALVLNSGGCDSTTCVSIAVDKLGAENVATVSISYGQRHSKELQCAEAVAEYYGLEHKVIDFTQTGIYDSSDCPLLAHSDKDIPEQSYAEQIAQNGEGRVETYIPYRNGLMLSAVAALAQSMFPDDDVDIYLGAHADDAAGNAYADCSEEFTDAIGRAISIGTYDKVHLVAPLVKWNKAEVIKKGLELGTPYHLTWSCYNGRKKACGVCGTCVDRVAAFRANGVVDPIEYEINDPFADIRNRKEK